jgi:hypothetical protein
MTRGCNDCRVGPVVSLFEASRDESVQLRFDSPDDSPALQTVAALRQSRRFYAWAGGFAVR